MSKLFKTIAVAMSLFAGSAMADSCGDVLFEGLTANHKKEVKVCVFSYNNENYIQYRFGKVGQKPEMDITQMAKRTSYEFLKGYNHHTGSIFISNGAYVYEVNEGVSDDGIESAELIVTNKNKTIAKIKLDVSTVKSDIWFSTGEYGLYNVSDEAYSEEFKLAPARVY